MSPGEHIQQPETIEQKALRHAYEAEIMNAFAVYCGGRSIGNSAEALCRFEHILGVTKECYRRALEVVKPL